MVFINGGRASYRTDVQYQTVMYCPIHTGYPAPLCTGPQGTGLGSSTEKHKQACVLVYACTGPQAGSLAPVLVDLPRALLAAPGGVWLCYSLHVLQPPYATALELCLLCLEVGSVRIL